MKKKENLENYAKPVYEETKSNFLYVIKPKNPFEISNLYDNFVAKSVAIDICEQKNYSVLKLETDKEIDVTSLAGDIELDFATKYDFIKDWNFFDCKPIEEEERRILFARLAQLAIHNENIERIFWIISAIGVVSSAVLSFLFGLKWILVGIGVIGIAFGMKYALTKQEKRHKESHDISEEPWLVFDCDIACSYTLIHRNGREDLKEKAFLLSQGNKCIKKIFSGLGLELGQNAKLFLRKSAIGELTNNDIFFEEDGSQIYYFNGAYMVIPDNYEIPDEILELLKWYDYRKLSKEEKAKIDEEKKAEKLRKQQEEAEAKAKERQKKKEEPKPVKPPKKIKEKEPDTLIIEDIRIKKERS